MSGNTHSGDAITPYALGAQLARELVRSGGETAPQRIGLPEQARLMFVRSADVGEFLSGYAAELARWKSLEGDEG